MLGIYPQENNTIVVNDAIVRIVAGVLAAMAVCALVIWIVLFVFRAVSLYKIARRRGIRNAWLVWLPVCGDWILGSVADQYQYVVKDRVKNRRLPLFLLSVARLGLRIVGAALSTGVVAYVLRLILTGGGYPEVGRWVLLTVVSMMQSIGTVVYLVLRGFVLYDVYSSCTSRFNVLFLVLGLIFPVLEPFFFFACRNKEEGMPPRREAPVYREPEVCVEE